MRMFMQFFCLSLLFAALGLLSAAHPASGILSDLDGTNPSAVGLSKVEIDDIIRQYANGTSGPSIVAREAASCGGYDAVDVASARVCAKWLANRSGLCGIPGGYGHSALFCNYKNAFIHGVGVNPNERIVTASICPDVGLAVYWTIARCEQGFSQNPGDSDDNFQVSGSWSANGNGGLLVVTKNRSGPAPHGKRVSSKRDSAQDTVPDNPEIPNTTEASDAANAPVRQRAAAPLQVTAEVSPILPREVDTITTNAKCGVYTPANVADVNSCSSYLRHNIGNVQCVVKGGYGASITFCHRGNQVIQGVGVNPDEQIQTASACRDVASAVDYIVKNCAQGSKVAGTAPAYGNGGLLVVVRTIESKEDKREETDEYPPLQDFFGGHMFVPTVNASLTAEQNCSLAETQSK